ncbi:putative RNA methyltransferase [Actinocrispum wychmicini]|uniref:23S rRNA (Guanine745-N1)-methyltransferase n=1 Tax=Actinocrispum wychmicini TaxID=1213861 RepID=A0A4R2JEL2_9PSEU|nr:rRNA (guanine-N1)-methyltransferase [Actinocrispum wychmicini]TCO56967.1 23S rRNA (guanine745-N1)-methyltransferase [Actinocrispum wychmicini]
MSTAEGNREAAGPVTFPRVPLVALRCPLCTTEFTLDDRALCCSTGHSFDIAKQGYVNLLGSGTGDSKEMVAARAEFLAAGHYAPLASLVASEAARDLRRDALVVDAGCGTGYYLGSVLSRAPAVSGLGLDSSVYAVRRAARTGVGAVVWDLWKPWPLASGSTDVILTVFAPRNPAEYHRVLRHGGTLLVVTPSSSHLAELRRYVDILGIEEDKLGRLDASLTDFVLARRHDCEIELTLSPRDVHRIVHMGPSAHHVRPIDVQEPVTVTAAFVVSVYRHV